MGRTDIGFYRPPVRIGPTAARGMARIMLRGSEQVTHGADQFEMRQGNYASVGLRLRIAKNSTHPNSQIAQRATLPAGRSRRKAGYPPIDIGAAGA